MANGSQQLPRARVQRTITAPDPVIITSKKGILRTSLHPIGFIERRKYEAWRSSNDGGEKELRLLELWVSCWSRQTRSWRSIPIGSDQAGIHWRTPAAHGAHQYLAKWRHPDRFGNCLPQIFIDF